MNYKQLIPFAVIGGVAAVGTYMASRLKLILSDDSNALYENDIFKLKLYPAGFVDRGDGPPTGVCQQMTLEVENLTDHDLHIDWSHTFYTLNGQTEEGFIHGGGGKALRTQMILPRRSDVVFPESKMVKQLKPLACIKEFEIPAISQLPLPSGNQTVAAPLGEGVHGIYLCIRDGETEYKPHVCFELSKEQKKGFFSNLFSGSDDGESADA